MAHYTALALAIIACMHTSSMQGGIYDFSSLNALMNSAITQQLFPGAVALIGYQKKIVYHKAFGHHTYDRVSPAVTTDTLFDIASITKLMATTAAAMLLYDAGQLSPEDLVCHYLPACSCNGKENIRIKHLLTHTSGVNHHTFDDTSNDATELLRQLYACRLAYPISSGYLYACDNFILLQKIIEQITQAALNDFVEQRIFRPLQMHQTRYNPCVTKNIAPTIAFDAMRQSSMQGQVHDPQAYILGSVAGNSGLFSTAHDLAQFMQMLLNDGTYNTQQGNQRLIRADTINTWMSPQCPFARGYGCEIGRHLSPHAFGHFGYTGTSVWADKAQNLFCILLTNRIYPNDSAGTRTAIKQFRINFHNVIIKILHGGSTPLYSRDAMQPVTIPSAAT